MQFLDDGVEEVMVNFQVDMDDRERTILFEHARDTMTEDEFEGLMINWAMVDVLTKKVNETLNTLLEEDK